MFADGEFAKDAFLLTYDTPTASNRLTNLQINTDREAGIQISISKTKNQHIMKTPTFSQKLRLILQPFHQKSSCNLNAISVVTPMQTNTVFLSIKQGSARRGRQIVLKTGKGQFQTR